MKRSVSALPLEKAVCTAAAVASGTGGWVYGVPEQDQECNQDNGSDCNRHRPYERLGPIGEAARLLVVLCHHPLCIAQVDLSSAGEGIAF
jgi:hypothetical protein